MKYSGKYGEYRVLAHLLELDVEAYPAIKTNQHDYDITAVLSASQVVRIQVKTTELNNRSTNNVIDRVDKNYDYLVVVIVDGEGNTKFYVMSKSEAMAAKGTAKQLGVTCQRNKQFFVKDTIALYRDQWNKIRA